MATRITRERGTFTRRRPFLRPRVEAALPRIYAKARGGAAAALRDYGEDAAAEALPEACPYDLDRITSDWLP